MSSFEKLKGDIEGKIVLLQQEVDAEVNRHFETISPLNVELARLQGALKVLNGEVLANGNGKRGRPRGTGMRAKEAIEIITRHPGLTASEIAVHLAINVNYLYRVLPALEQEGKIEKRGRGWHMVGVG